MTTLNFDERSFEATARAVIKYNPCSRGYSVEDMVFHMKEVAAGYKDGWVATSGFCISYGTWSDGSIHCKATLDVWYLSDNLGIEVA